MRTSKPLVAAALLILSVAPARPQAIGEWGRLGGAARPPAAGRPVAAPVPARAAKPAAKPARPAAPLALADSAQELAIVRRLADPALEGRGASTAGIEKAATLIRSEMERIGLRPAGPGDGWGEPFEVTTGVEVGTPSFITVAGRRLDEGEDYEPLGFSTNGTLRAPVVFAGYGITAPGFDYDDYAGIDARERIVLVLTNEPGEMDSTSRFDGTVNTPHAELRTKAINAREHGALGLIVVNGPRWHAGEPLRRPRADGGGYMSGGLVAALLADSIADRLVRRAGESLAQAQMDIDNVTKPHSFTLPDSVTLTVTLRRTRSKVHNVVGAIPGRDTTRVLVVGAHYDHLGYGGESSLAPDQHVPHVGADDNASGTAALLGTAGLMAQRMKGGWRPEHTLLFCAFTGEEMGLVGSSHFVDDPPRPLGSVEAMLNMDMVGRLRDDKLMVMGAGTAEEFPALIESANRTAGFQIKTSSDGYGPSDHSSFYKKKVPVLMLFTGAHADYHKPSDTWDKINENGLWRVTRFAAALVESLDARPRPRFVQAKSDSNVGRIAGGGGYGAYLGTIPDYMQTEGGVLLSGVRSGSPAEQAGLRQADVIVRFDGVGIDNIYDYTFALRSRKPGQQVALTVRRDGVLVTLNATLGRRP
ncbi:MAG: M28 family peptidase [Candidatus Eisenbacteria bacterium]|nr:M28 family peptidase [Candidatus Eisenbacteria bacterium]